MNDSEASRWDIADTVFQLLDPVPYGCFVGALVFDAIYTRSNDSLWVKGAAWLIAIGLLFAVVPRLLNLVRVWFPGRRLPAAGLKFGFWLNVLAVLAAILNAFVHSRDAYGVMPEGLWLSAITVALLVMARVRPSVQAQGVHP